MGIYCNNVPLEGRGKENRLVCWLEAELEAGWQCGGGDWAQRRFTVGGNTQQAKISTRVQEAAKHNRYHLEIGCGYHMKTTETI